MIRPARLASFLVVLLLAASPALADDQLMRHSGTIVGLDRDGSRIAIAEVGPWSVRHGSSEVIILTIGMTEATPITLVQRAPDAPSGFRNDFVEERLEPWDLVFFDFVTVECLHRGGRLIALGVTVLGPDLP
jgi:hypothetical protein